MAGSSYRLYSVNVDGTINKPSETFNPITQPKENRAYSSNSTQVLYYIDGKLATYNYNKTTGQYYFNDNLVDSATNAALIKQLEYNRQVVDGKITYETKDKNYKYYIINDTDSPLVIKIDQYYHVTELSSKESKEYIDKVNKAKEDKKREAAAKQKLEEMSKSEEVDLGLEDNPTTPTTLVTDSGLAYDPTTGGLTDLSEQQKLEEQKKAEEEAEKKRQEELKNKMNPPKKPVAKGNTQTFESLYKSRQYRTTIMNAIRSKWSDAPKKLSKLSKFLEDHGVEVTSIGTSKEDIQTWIDTLINCK